MANSKTTVLHPDSPSFVGFTLTDWLALHGIRQFDTHGELCFRKGQEELRVPEAAPFGFSYKQIADFLGLNLQLPPAHVRFHTTAARIVLETAEKLGKEAREITINDLTNFAAAAVRPPVVPEASAFQDMWKDSNVKAFVVTDDAQFSYAKTAYPNGQLVSRDGEKIFILDPVGAGEYYLPEAANVAGTLSRWLASEELTCEDKLSEQTSEAPQPPESRCASEPAPRTERVFEESWSCELDVEKVVKEVVLHYGLDANTAAERAYYATATQVALSPAMTRKVKHVVLSKKSTLEEIVMSLKGVLEGSFPVSEGLVAMCILKRRGQFNLQTQAPHMLTPKILECGPQL